MSANIVQRIRTWSTKQIFIVFAAFLVYVLADGTTFSFGLYVDQLIDEYSKHRKNTVFSTSTIAALTQSVPLLLSPLVCWWTTKFGASTASLAGCLISSIGYILPFLLQFTKTFWVPAIGYGIFLSVGLAFCYVPAYLTLPIYFEEDRGLATGLAVSGSGVGQVLLAVAIKVYMIEYGWRGASLITGGLFLFMLIAVLAFRKSPTSNETSSNAVENDDSNPMVIIPVPAAPAAPATELDISIEPSISRRSRRMTLAQVLPMLISSVPVHTSVPMPTPDKNRTRRHSLNIHLRTRTETSEPFPISTNETKGFRRARSNTIAVPMQTVPATVGRSFERIRLSSRQQPLDPIAAEEEDLELEALKLYNLSDEVTDREGITNGSIISFSEINEPVEKVTDTKPWFINARFLLFCFSNFALCLVIGVPYVIIPTYISETFHDQRYLASWVLSNVGIASAVGQIILGYLHDRKIFKAWVMYTFAVITSGTSLVIIALFRSKIVVLSCGFLFGLAISANYALQVLIVIDTLTMENMANAFGILQFCQGISTLIGIPFSGLLRDLTKTYQLSFITSGLIIILSGLCMLLWPCLKSKDKDKKQQVANDG